MKKFRRDDEVVVIAGKDKGRRSKIVKVLSSGKLIVKDVNIVKKHVKPNPAQNVPGSIVSKEAPIEASNVSIWNLKSEKRDRVGFRFTTDGGKERFYKSNGKAISGK